MTDQELEQEVDRIMDELISVVDGQPALASDLAMVDVLAAGCTDITDCKLMMGMVMEALADRMLELATETGVLH